MIVGLPIRKQGKAISIGVMAIFASYAEIALL